MSSTSESDPAALMDRVVSIIESARARVVRTLNQQMVIAYWLIGREIVRELQGGEPRAQYGQALIKKLSEHLTQRYGKGYSMRNLELFRMFYVSYNQHLEIPYTVSTQLTGPVESLVSPAADNRESTLKIPLFHPNLSWSHYRILMTIEKPQAREFYERETANNGWSVRQLERQIHSFFFERLLKSQDQAAMLEQASQPEAGFKPIDVIKDPYILEFLDLPESPRLQESDLEAALINCLQEFLLELGTGFAFIGRQKRITLEGDHFYPDLVFYHIRLRCYVIVDLKTGKLTHGDLGQMQMYVGYYDQEIRRPDEGPTIGLVLCSDKNDAMVRYVLKEETKQVFASRYLLELPSEEQLVRELNRERILLEQQERAEI